MNHKFGNALIPARRISQFGAWIGCLVITLAMSFLSSPARADNAEQCSKFTYYVLALEWPQTFCIKEASKDDCSIPEQVTGWIVHGLWPNGDKPRSYPSDCTGPAYSRSNVTDLLSDRRILWPDLLSTNDENASQRSGGLGPGGFWKHEWQEHGLCALACDSAVTSMTDYFALAMNLAKKIDVSQSLQSAGIEPDNSTPVTTSQLVSAMKQSAGAAPAIACYSDSDDGNSYLSEIRFCMKPGSHELFDCQPEIVSEYRSCPAQFIYPSESGG